MIKRFLFPLAGIAALTLSASTARAQANLTFSGGSGSPLTINLTSPITYTLTTASVTQPGFIFDAIGNGLSNNSAFTGTWTFSINGGSPLTLTNVQSATTLGSAITPDDIIVFSNVSNLSFAVGDKVELSAASVTTNAVQQNTKPSDGSYQTFISNTNGVKISSNGVSAAVVPEANTAALLGLALPMIGTVAVARRRKKQ